MTPSHETTENSSAPSEADNGLASAELTSLLYSELRRLAGHYMQQERSNHTLQATALVHEVYVRLAELHGPLWKNRNEFMAAASQQMRRILLDYSRRHQSAKRGGNTPRVFLEEVIVPSKARPADVVALDEALVKLAALDEQQAHLVELRFFAGLSIEEAAGVLEISPATVKRHWNVAKAWLARELAGGQ
jgi:RNA polymerase sigma factor (TIGR02999 family)